MQTQETFENNAWSHPAARQRSDEQLALGLGFFSIGLGLAEVFAPAKVAELIGVKNHYTARSVLRFYGYRELAAGLGILSQPGQSRWLWGRVAGDFLDLASLSSAMASRENDTTKVAAAAAAVVGVTALDLLCAQQLSRKSEQASPHGNGRVQVSKTIIVNRSPEEVYRFWRDFENFPRFMTNLQSVRVIGERHTRWEASGPGGVKFAWEAETIDDQPNSRIAWRSVEGSGIQNSGSVTFQRAPGGRGTLVRVQVEYDPPGGGVGASIAKLFWKEPGQQIETDLRRFKQVIETGEIVNSDASIHRGMHPAQPTRRRPAQVGNTGGIR